MLLSTFAGRFIDAVGTSPVLLGRIKNKPVARDLFPFPVNPGLAQSAQAAGIMVGDRKVDLFPQLQFAVLDQPVDVFRDMQHFQVALQFELVIEHLESLIAVGAGRDDRFGAGFLNHGHVLLGLFEKILFIAHLVGAPAAAGLVVSGDAEINAGLLQYLRGRLGQLMHFRVIARETADVIDYVHLLFGRIFQLQAGGPGTAFPVRRHHGSFFPQASDDLVQSRTRLAVCRPL